MNWITQRTEMAVALTTSAGNVGPLPSFEFVQYALGLQAEIVAAAESPVYLPPGQGLTAAAEPEAFSSLHGGMDHATERLTIGQLLAFVCEHNAELEIVSTTMTPVTDPTLLASQRALLSRDRKVMGVPEHAATAYQLFLQGLPH